ncbi:hypothetical protein MSMTP_2816 [Methanosarcina sp. MTP4]|uniref:transcriptional regulator n=1 Tax=unclassified Methanosarcina TaxID=2644672 RepID=UPI00061599C2|nr:transcriptional regulator [Methanosarcina sp. MTP4]AKB26285.1 hypothetical protein MSMTP_2816 [Methanosarcina sp. MTP4]
MLYIDTDYAPETCSLCKGAGHTGSRICEACGGSGTVLVAQPARNCPLCGGAGYLGTDICRACGGSGWALY